MRIVIDLQGAQTESRFRGIGRYTISFAQGVVRNRGKHEVILALSGLFPDTIEPIRAAFEGHLPQENIRVWRAPGPVCEERQDNDARREVAEIIREAFLASLQPDVIHISSLFEGYVDDAVTSIGRFDTLTPVSVTLYDLIPLLNSEQYLKPNPRYQKYYLRKIDHLQRAALGLSISDFSRNEAIEVLGTEGDRIVDVSTAIEAHFQPRSIDDAASKRIRGKFGLKRPFVLYTGGSDERKNLPRLIQAYATLPAATRAGHQLVFTGKMPEGDLARFRQQAKTAGLQADELIFTGYVTDEDLVQLYNLCQLYVFPSWHEGFGLPALEAMSCGAPVIGANTSSLPEVIGLDVALIDPLDVAAIADKIQQSLTDEAFRTRLKVHGLQQAKRFSWDETAKRAIAAWEALQLSSAKVDYHLPTGRKPRLAFVSPLPPEPTGIADYSSELLPALSAHYDIELIVSQEQVVDPWVNQHGKVRDVSWLRANAQNVDRVLYQMGNSPFHHHMLPLLREIPGAVVLHDFYMSGQIAWLELHAGAEHAWDQALYDSHGYGAVRARYNDAEAAKREYPVNFDSLQNARGIIVHSDYSRQLARQWYGKHIADDWVVIPLLRTPASAFSKREAKNQLGFGEDDFVICSFGFLDPTKLNHRLLECWLASSLSLDAHCHLVFVGENHGGDYGAGLLKSINNSGLDKRIRITGFVSLGVFRQHLMAADVAVQLRTQSRGETSAAVMDCMNHALAVIVNANGSMVELNPEAVWLLPDEFDDAMLIEALETLRQNQEKRHHIGGMARQVILDYHGPERCAKQYAEAIECFHRRSETTAPALVRAVAEQVGESIADADLRQLAACIASTLPMARPAKRLFLDISATCRNDLKTGIQRVVRAILLALMETPPSGYRIEPVYLDQIEGKWFHRHACRYTLGLQGCPSEALGDEIVEPGCGDVMLVLDLAGDMLSQAQQAGLFAGYRNIGVAVYAMVFDLLPVYMAEVFPPGADAIHRRWLKSISEFDGAICISKSVANDLERWQNDVGFRWIDRRQYLVGWFHLGADLANFASTRGLPENVVTILNQYRARPTFLMVGTIEPRKGYLQTIDAFTQLWENGVDVNLVVVGKEGWQGLPDKMRRSIPQTVQRLRTHPELNKRLFWLDGISDEYLEKVYASSACLIAASCGEGFGLPLIEAAQHKLPIVARDIPVFREVAGEHAYYFSSRDSHGLAQSIEEWLRLYEKREHPVSDNMPWLTWKESAARLNDIVISRRWSKRQVSPKKKEWIFNNHLDLIHRNRIRLISTLLPPGEVILDLGGANSPLHKMGYKYMFKKLYLIDLPPEERCEMYKDIVVDSDCEGGEVVIKYGDMTELDDFPDNSVDLVWSGQSIEHVPIDAGQRMCHAAYRVLKPGGAFCLDTPNRLITRIHTRDIGGGFIHEEHFIEYEPKQLREMLETAGFVIQCVLGVCEMPVTAANGCFDYTDFLYGEPISKDVDKSYIQYFHCVKPLN